MSDLQKKGNAKEDSSDTQIEFKVDEQEEEQEKATKETTQAPETEPKESILDRLFNPEERMASKKMVQGRKVIFDAKLALMESAIQSQLLPPWDKLIELSIKPGVFSGQPLTEKIHIKNKESVTSSIKVTRSLKDYLAFKREIERLRHAWYKVPDVDHICNKAIESINDIYKEEKVIENSIDLQIEPSDAQSEINLTRNKNDAIKRILSDLLIDITCVEDLRKRFSEVGGVNEVCDSTKKSLLEMTSGLNKRIKVDESDISITEEKD